MSTRMARSLDELFGGHSPCIVAGIAGALASVVGKFAFDGDSAVVEIMHAGCTQVVPVTEVVCHGVALATRGGLFACMLMLNVMMLNMSVKGLRISGSVTATVLTSAVNFILSAVLGFAFFGEVLPPLWWAGACLIIAGVLLVSQDGGEAAAVRDVPDTEQPYAHGIRKVHTL